MRCLAVLFLLAPSLSSAGKFKSHQQERPRVKAAFAEHAARMEAAFAKAGAEWPPSGIFLRAFKADDVVELWAATPEKAAPWVRVRNFAICARSGELGPKYQVGDGQVPEGFYHINRFNPRSRFHLSLGLDYPHAGDRARTPKGKSPGGDIFIHGDCVTIGCLPLEDAPMEALYVAAVEAFDRGQRRIPVHIFPCRLDQPDCQIRLAAASFGRPELAEFWQDLRLGYLHFEATRRPPKVRPKADGGWRVADL